MLQRVILWVMIMFVALCTVPTAAYADTIETMPTHLPSYPPLLITSYRTLDSGTDISYIELYNNGKSPLSIDDYQLIVNGDADKRITLTAHTAGVLLPGNHTVASAESASHVPYVGGASFSLEYVKDSNVIKTITIQHPSYRDLTATLSIKQAEVDQPMVRGYNTDSYSTATSPFGLVTAQDIRDSSQPLYEDGLYQVPLAPDGLRIIEIYPYASSCSPFDTSILCGDYIKIANDSEHTIVLDDYVLRTDSSSASRTNANTFTLSGELEPGEVLPIWQTDAGSRISLTNSGGYVWFEDISGLGIYKQTITQYAAAGSTLQGYAYALADDGSWQWTMTPMPDSDNSITPVVHVCVDGQYFNPDTNRCRTLEGALNALTPCRDGYVRNAETNRCRKVVTSTSTLTPCKANQIRNPETNRCKSATSSSTGLVPCKEGYERNPATNRCRKTAVAGASTAYPVEAYGETHGSWAAWAAIGGVAAVAIGYGIWEWRQEIGAAFGRIASRFRR